MKSQKEYRKIKSVLVISLFLLSLSLLSIVSSWHEELPELQEKRYSISLNDIKDISAGASHTCAILDDGSVSCWGLNEGGQLGDGTNNDRLTPTQTASLGTDRTAVAITAGYSHSCAILDDGSVSCWGKNGDGQLGDGTTTGRNTTTQTSSLGEGLTAVAITAGYSHSCAILDDGSVSCWGSNGDGQLGDGTTTSRHTPTQTSSLGTNRTAVAISAGYHHTCAILDNGSVSCWGSNGHGQLGDGTTTSRHTPTQTSSLGTNRTAVAISAGVHHTCAILDNGSVSCWGRNSSGELGDGEWQRDLEREIPSLTSSLGTNRTAVAISAGASHTCAILDDGSVSCWGLNDQGQLGDGSTTPRPTPTQTASLGTDRTAIAITTGDRHTCAILDDESVSCWGKNGDGQLGDGSTYFYRTSPTIKEEEIPLFVWVMVIIFLMLIAWGYDDEEIQTEKNKKVAKKEWEIPTHKKIFFGLWKRKLTGMEQLYAIAPEIVYNHYSNKNNQENPIENKKVGIIDMVHTITNIRCTHCDGPTEGGPRRGTYLCASCGFLFDSKGDTL